MDVVMTDSRQRIAEDHLQAMLKANQAADARERLDRLIDEDNKHAAWTATAWRDGPRGLEGRGGWRGGSSL